MLVVFKTQFPTGAATWLTVGLVAVHGRNDSVLCPLASSS
jgi:hypothetical protein